MEPKVSLSKHRSLIRLIYIAMLAFALGLHVFNMGGEEGLKPFHLAAGIACVLTFLQPQKLNNLYRIVYAFLLFAFFSAIFSYASSAFSTWVNLFFVVISCIGVVFSNVKIVLKCVFPLIAADVFALLYQSIVEPQYRFQGFYDDPNYLCTTLLGFIFLLLLELHLLKKYYLKIFAIALLILSYFLILLTLSRTGIVCAFIILVIVLLDSLKKKYLKITIISLILFSVCFNITSNYFDHQLALLNERFFYNNDNIENASDQRVHLSMQNVEFILDNPQYILFGLGGGTTIGKNAHDIPELDSYRDDDHGDHNTWTSTFSEFGLLCFIMFFLFFIITFRRVIRITPHYFRNLYLVMFASMLIFSFSISQKTYLPFWWIMFFLNNQTISQLSQSER